jgi:3-oxoacyl-[acyl-carrier-protein] synthase-3
MLYLHGCGHFHPENELDNRLLESLDIGTNDEWIVSRVGIKNRRTVLPFDYIKATKN